MVADKTNLAGAIGSVPGISNERPLSQKEKTTGPSFGDVLGKKLEPSKVDLPTTGKALEGVRFSNHALERMTSRGISFKPEEMMKLNEAVEKAASKGSRETLVLMGETALIVSIKNRTVVTAMDRAAMKENVFTNIDSTVVL